MFSIIQHWFKRRFSDPQAVLLFVLLLIALLTLIFVGEILTPVLASVVLAYALQWVADSLQKHGMPRMLSLIVVYLCFLSLFLLGIFVLMPLLWQQLGRLFDELPNMLSRTQTLLYMIPERFPDYLSKADIDHLSQDLVFGLRNLGRTVLSASLSSIPSLLALMIYLVLVPLMVFFFLKDKDDIVAWGCAFLPKQRELLSRVWTEVNAQLGNYIRGKLAEMLIVGVATYLTFLFFGLKYAMLLGFLVGLSVLVPYVGAVLVTVPVLFVAFVQWGTTSDFLYVILAYLAIQGLDGNVLVPLLFSEAVNLHPVAIIIAIITFGGFWGVWGVFFAIPLAVLVKAVLYAWPSAQEAS